MYVSMSVGMSKIAISQNPLQSLPGDMCNCTCTCHLVQIKFSLSHTAQAKEDVVLAIIAILSFYASFLHLLLAHFYLFIDCSKELFIKLQLSFIDFIDRK